MRLSDRVESLSPSLTLQLVGKTKQLRAAGRDIVSLGAGEPDFPTPANVRRAAARAIESGHTRYTEVGGILKLRTAIVDHYRERGLTYEPDQVVVTSGAKHALFEAVQVLVNPGDEVLIPSPYWLSYPEIVKAAGGVPVFVPCREDDGFLLHHEDVAAACTARTRLLIINPINNPTGNVDSPEVLAAIAAVCRDKDIGVVSDEIYERLVYEPARTVPFATVSEDAASRTVVISGVSKTFAMTGWRIGYALGPAPVIAGMRKLQGQSTSNACSISQHAALEAITGDQTEIVHMVEEFHRRRDRMLELLRAIPGVSVMKPQGAFYVFPRVDAYYGRREGIDGSLSLADAILEEAGVVVVPGLPFGSDAHIRLSYACSMDDVEDALGRLTRFLAGL